MIELYPPNALYSALILGGIVLVAAAVSARAGLRWGWRGWPAMFVSVVLAPVLVLMIVFLVLLIEGDGNAFALSTSRPELLLIITALSAGAGFVCGLGLLRPRHGGDQMGR